MNLYFRKRKKFNLFGLAMLVGTFVGASFMSFVLIMVLFWIVILYNNITSEDVLNFVWSSADIECFIIISLIFGLIVFVSSLLSGTIKIKDYIWIEVKE